MKKIVLTFGLIAGVLLSAMMAITMPYQHSIGYERAMVIGYTTMVLSFLFVFFGVRSYRDNVRGGRIGFGRAMAVGGLIALMASACYVVTWEAMYFKFAPHYQADMRKTMIEHARSEAGTPEEAAAKVAEAEKFMAMYQNPAINAAFTFLEPLPVALVFTLVSAGILSRRRRDPRTGLSTALA